MQQHASMAGFGKRQKGLILILSSKPRYLFKEITLFLYLSQDSRVVFDAGNSKNRISETYSLDLDWWIIQQNKRLDKIKETLVREIRVLEFIRRESQNRES